MPPRRIAQLALLGTNLFFAINFTAVKYLINKGLVAPFGLNIIRIGITAALLWLMFFFKQSGKKIDRSDWGRLVLCALSGIVINQLLFIKGLSLTYPIHASLLMLITPILISILASITLKEKLSGVKGLGLLFGCVGAFFLISARSHTSLAQNVVLGDVLVIINAVSYTIYFILVKPLMLKYPPVTIIRMIFSIGFFLALPFCWNDFQTIVWQKFERIDYAVLSIIVVGGTFLAYLFNVYGIKILGASSAGSYIYAQPLFASAIAMLFFNESLDLYKIIAAGCIFAGVYFVNRKPSHD